MTMDKNELADTSVSDIVSSVKNTSKITDIIKRRNKAVVGEEDEKTKTVRTYYQIGRDIKNATKAMGGTKPLSKRSRKEQEKRNSFDEEFDRRIFMMPEKDRTEKNIGDLGRELIFEITTSDRKKRNLALKNPPPTLQKMENLNYNVDHKVYYFDYGDTRSLYDKDGNYIGKGKKIK